MLIRAVYRARYIHIRSLWMTGGGKQGVTRPEAARLLGAERGAIAPIFAVVLVAILGLAGLVHDFGRAWIFQTDLQAAVDAAALLGATQLDGTPGARARAVAAAANAGARNTETFSARLDSAATDFDTAFPCQGEGCAMTNGSFRFLSSLTPRSDALNDNEAKHLEVMAAGDLRFALAGLVGGPDAVAPQAAATGSWARYACGRAALLLCNPDEAPGNRDLRAAFDPRRHAGKGITLRTGTAAGAGAMAWLSVVTCDAVDHSCNAAAGTGAVADALARVLPAQACMDAATISQATTGDLAAAINTRLDIYSEPGPSRDPAFQPSPNFLSGLVPQAGAVVDGELADCSFPGALVPAAQPYLGPGRHPPFGTAPLDHVGYPRDNCAYPLAGGGAPADSCMAGAPGGSELPGGQALGSGDWDLPAYMAFHHPSLDFAGWSFNACPTGGCRLGGDNAVDLDENNHLSRWEVYKWERNGPAPNFGRPQCFGAGTAVLPQAPADSPRASDRRLLGALVANCQAIATAFGAGVFSAESVLPLAGGASTLSLFLSEAVGELAPGVLYAEIVAPVAVTGVPPLVTRDRVVLSE